MVNLDPVKILGYQLDVNFEQDAFSVILEKLAASGMTTFRLNWKPDVAVCIAFDAEGSKALNDALDGYLARLE